jgi:hypothetical protein
LRGPDQLREGGEGTNRRLCDCPRPIYREESARGRAQHGDGAQAGQCSSWHEGQAIHSSSGEPSVRASSSPAAAGASREPPTSLVGAGLPPPADREGFGTRAQGSAPQSEGMSESSHLASEGHGCREASSHGHVGDAPPVKGSRRARGTSRGRTRCGQQAPPQFRGLVVLGVDLGHASPLKSEDGRI